MTETHHQTDLHLIQDCVQPFQIETNAFRGRLVRVGPALDMILKKHAYPTPVAMLLGETVAVAVALAFSLKYEGKFTLQSKGDGPVKLLVADVQSNGDIRGYAQFDDTGVARMGDEGIGLLGKGYLAFTVDQSNLPGADTYQGIVELRGKNIAEATQTYFRQSEQIPTALIAAVRQDEGGIWHGGALMLQRMPLKGGKSPKLVEGSQAEDDWRRAMIIMSTCTPEELTAATLAPNDLLFRLFHEDGVRITPARAVRHACACRERVPQTLRLFGAQAVEDMADDKGLVSMTCQFCNASYTFDAPQRAALFSEEP